VKGTSASRGTTSDLTRDAMAFKLAACNMQKQLSWIVEIGENEIEEGRREWT